MPRAAAYVNSRRLMVAAQKTPIVAARSTATPCRPAIRGRCHQRPYSVPQHHHQQTQQRQRHARGRFVLARAPSAVECQGSGDDGTRNTAPRRDEPLLGSAVHRGEVSDGGSGGGSGAGGPGGRYGPNYDGSGGDGDGSDGGLGRRQLPLLRRLLLAAAGCCSLTHATNALALAHAHTHTPR